MKRLISMILALAMSFGMLPVGEMVAFAADQQPTEVESISMTRTYRGATLESIKVDIVGKGLLKADVIFSSGSKGDKIEPKDDYNTYKSYEITEDKYKNVRIVSDEFNQVFDISESNLPTISSDGVTPKNGYVKSGEYVYLRGSNFDKIVNSDSIGNSGVKGTIKGPDSNDEIKITDITADKKQIEKITGNSTGDYDVVFQNEIDGSDSKPKEIRIHNYENLFTVYGELGIKDNITMIPNRGKKGSYITLEAPFQELLSEDQISIFFLRRGDLSDTYRKENMATEGEYTEGTKGKDGKKDKFTAKVPENLKPGRYDVIITNHISNKIANSKDKITITASKEFNNNIFTVIEGNFTASIKDMYEKQGPETGIDAIIQGQNIASFNESIFSTKKKPKIVDYNPENKYLNVKYEANSGNPITSIGQYYATGDPDEGIEVKSIERKIIITIGDTPATFKEIESFNHTADNFNIRVPGIDLEAGEDPRKDVVVRVETTIIPLDENLDNQKMTETATWLGGKFEYKPVKFNPKITSIIPSEIQVDKENKISEDLQIYITGENFVKYKYTKGNGEKIKYPIINIGDQITLDKNIPITDDKKSTDSFLIGDDVKLEVLEKGMAIDGKLKSQGDKVIITLPKGTQINPDILDDPRELKLWNPIKNDIDITNIKESKEHRVLTPATKGIKFIKPSVIDLPKITDILPTRARSANSKKAEELTITGSNFSQDVEVIIGDIKVEGVKTNNAGTEIYFKEPIDIPEGIYQLIIKNEKGMALDFLIYESSNTKPEIFDFELKEGTNGDEIYLTGDGILFPSAQVSNPEIGFNSHRFIGTKVIFQRVGTNRKKDMNEYNYKDNTEIIELKPYKNTAKDIVYIDSKTNKLELSEYYQSIIFQEQKNNEDKKDSYFVLKRDKENKDIILTNDANINYTLSYKGNNLFANGTNEVKITNDGIEIEDLDLVLKMKTPYTQDINGNIVGHKVKITSDKELKFEVSLLPEESLGEVQGGEYFITLRNPGIESERAKEKFSYLTQPGSKPQIDSIQHVNEGSSLGGYYRTIKGSGFLEGVKVYIGTTSIPEKDINFVSKEKIIVKIPRYEGKDIDLSSDGRKTLPLAIKNPDRGSSTYDFIYVNAKSKPRIDSISPNFGPISGDKVEGITIYEREDFRFFQSYIGTKPNDHIDLNIKEDRDRLGGSERNKENVENGNWNKQLEILPTVFFGGELADIIRYDPIGIGSSGRKSITVEIPKGIEGKVPVYLENNDFGISNEKDFEYKKIDIGNIEIKPGTGNRRGNASAEIRSTDKDKKKIFSESEIEVFNKNGSSSNQKHQLVRFGDRNDLNMSNISINGNMQQTVADNSGRIVNNNANVEVGNLKINYKKDDDKETLDFTLKDTKYDEEKEEHEDVEYKFTGNFPKDKDEVFLPINLLTNGNENYKGFELVRISKGRFTIDGKLSNVDKLTVQRGYSPETIVKQNGKYIELKTPSYDSVGNVNVTVINADGSEASTKYIYTNPANNPSITDVFREGNPTTDAERAKNKKVIKVDYRGGVKFHIKGKQFRKPSRIDIGGSVSIQGDKLNENGTGIEHLPEVADKEDYEELVFIMPEVPESYVGNEYSFIVTTPNDETGNNLNSATTSSADGEFKIYVEFTKGETNPKLTNITPKKGPSSGGTEITIEGEDFRKKDPEAGLYGDLRVFVGENEIDKGKITFVNSKKLKVIAPPHESGTVKIKVENPDGTIAAVEGNNDQYTYVSNPKITNIVDPLNGDIKKPSLSIEGGEEIKVVGSDFMQGARVVFNPVLTRVSEKPDAQGERIFINGVEYILESGTPGTDVEFIDSENIRVKTPSGTIDTGGVIVINPDGAATPEYEIGYVIPEISHPQKVRANLIKDEYIRINWNEVVDKATEADGKKVQYEVYMIDGTNREFLGSTATTGFIFRDIKPNTTYKFLVRAVGKYGSSKPINESMSNEVKTGSTAGPVDQDGKPGENTTVNKTGDTGNVVIGEDAFTSGSEYVIDLTRGELAGSKDLVVSMSAKIVVGGKNRNIKVVGSDYNLSFSPNVFENSTLRNNKDKSSAGVKFEVSPSDGRFELSNNRGDTILASNYLLEAKAFVGASSESLENLNGKINLILDYDQDLARRRRFKESDINLVKYDPYDRAFKEVFGNRSSYGTSIGDIDGLGTYTITGSRR